MRRATSTLTITLTGTNDTPVAVADTNAGNEDTTITGTVATNDSDVDDGAVLSYATTGPVPAGLTFNSNGSYSFDAATPPTSTWRKARRRSWLSATPSPTSTARPATAR